MIIYMIIYNNTDYPFLNKYYLLYKMNVLLNYNITSIISHVATLLPQM